MVFVVSVTADLVTVCGMIRVCTVSTVRETPRDGTVRAVRLASTSRWRDRAVFLVAATPQVRQANMADLEVSLQLLPFCWILFLF